MSEPPTPPEQPLDTATMPPVATRDSYPGLPGWLKWPLIVVLLLVAAVVLATALGLHHVGGPGGHGL